MVTQEFRTEEKTLMTPPTPMTAPVPPPPIEEIHVTGEALLAKVKELVYEGNVRRIVLKNEDGHVIAEFPLMLGVVGMLLAPVWAALGAIAALAANLTILVERRETTHP